MSATKRLAAMRAILEAATPRPWAAVSRSLDEQDDDYFLGWEIDGPPDAYRGQFERKADAQFIAHARADMPALLAVVEAAVAWREADKRYGECPCPSTLGVLEAEALSEMVRAIDAFREGSDG